MQKLEPQGVPKAAVIGWPVEHTLSPRLHGYWLRACQLAGTYKALPIDPVHFDQRFLKLGHEGYRGVNVTVPFKEKAFAAIRAISGVLDDLSCRVGAVNTVIYRDETTVEGRNTDVYGFRQNLETNGFRGTDRPVVIFGAGGAARAVVAALQDMGVADLRVVNRTVNRAETMVDQMRFRTTTFKLYEWHEIDKALSSAALLVNTTPLTMTTDHATVWDLSSLPNDAIVTDVVYSPLKTDLLLAADNRRLQTIDGLGMLMYQAQPAFEAFFGTNPAVTNELRQFLTETR